MRLTDCTFHPLLATIPLTNCKRLEYCSVALSSHRCTYPCPLSDVLLNLKVYMTGFVWPLHRTFDFPVSAASTSCTPVYLCSHESPPCSCTGSIFYLPSPSSSSLLEHSFVHVSQALDILSSLSVASSSPFSSAFPTPWSTLFPVPPSRFLLLDSR